MDTKTFINKSKIIHNDKYDYSLAEYINPKIKVRIICNKCDHIWDILPYNHLNGKGCKKCQYKNLPQNKPFTQEEFIKLAKIKHKNNYGYSLTKYKNKRTKIKIKCNKCDNVFEQRPDSHLNGNNGCKKCQYEKLPQNKIKLSIKEFEEKCKNLHDDKYIYFQDYNGSRNKIKIKCKLHDFIFNQFGYAHLNKKQGCPLCKKSKGELIIKKWLDDQKIKYTPQKTFNDCKFKLPLPFDFYLEEKNICIEFDGLQHYRSIKFYGGNIGLKKRKEYDRIKNEYCTSKKIKLIRIRYNENIEKKLNKILC